MSILLIKNVSFNGDENIICCPYSVHWFIIRFNYNIIHCILLSVTYSCVTGLSSARQRMVRRCRHHLHCRQLPTQRLYSLFIADNTIILYIPILYNTVPSLLPDIYILSPVHDTSVVRCIIFYVDRVIDNSPWL